MTDTWTVDTATPYTTAAPAAPPAPATPPSPIERSHAADHADDNR